MSLGNALSIAVSGLTASQARAQTVAANIANANTEGYSRRVTQLAERTVGDQNSGVRVIGTQRAESFYLTNDRMRLEASSGSAKERATVAARLNKLLGNPGSKTGLFGDYVRFEKALRDAIATPESKTTQSDVVDRARALTKTFSSISESADKQRNLADKSIATAVNDINEALERLEEYNTLAKSEVTPVVQDERQRLIDKINKLIPVTPQTNDDGTLKLVTEGGVFLLDVSAKKIDFNASGNVARGQTLGSPLSGISVNGIDITPGGASSQQVKSGKIAAYFEIRDTTVPKFQDKIDALAADLINRFSDDTADPTKTTGGAGLFTDGTANPPGLTTISGAAQRLTLNAAVDPSQGGSLHRIRDGLGATKEGPAGNGDQLNRLLKAFTAARAAPDALGSSSGAGGAAGLASKVSASVAFDDRNAAEAALFAGTRYDAARKTELGSVGVDTDQELQQLLLIEKSYAANARVIQTVQQMLDELMRAL